MKNGISYNEFLGGFSNLYKHYFGKITSYIRLVYAFIALDRAHDLGMCRFGKRVRDVYEASSTLAIPLNHGVRASPGT
jgi:hypothetical protein